jgi:4-hydroxybenzoate polyprenyltransferase
MLSDLKDLDGDKRAGLKTFPTVHGLDATLKLLVIVNTLGIIALISGWLFFSLKVSMFLLPLIAISRYYVLWLVSSGQKSAYYVYDKFDRPTESSIGPLAIIGRLLIH